MRRAALNSTDATPSAQKCGLCDREDGAVIQCGECPAEYHVSCAWKQGHKFGFEIQQQVRTPRLSPARGDGA